MEEGRSRSEVRKVSLPDDIGGRLYLHSMPGRDEDLAQVWRSLESLSVSAVVCLAPLDEIQRKSPTYADAIEAGTVPISIRRLPVADYQGPDDDQAFREMAGEVADQLRRGKAVLVHCGAGVGRTGMFAIAVLMMLGLPIDEARRVVRAAGSGPETQSQQDGLRRLAQSVGYPSNSEEEPPL
jgi:protein-tyrosine phosphatase